jgi:AraC-like DNA-binding protein
VVQLIAQAPKRGAQVSLAATAGLVPFIETLGADPDRLLGPAGIDGAHLDPHRDDSIELSAYVAMMERGAALSHCGNFGLRYGRQFPASEHGVIADVALAAPTIGTALRYFVGLFPLHQEATETACRLEGGLLRLEYRILDWRIYERRQDAELTIAMFLNLLRHAYGPGFVPDEVHFEHPAPSCTAEHEATFGAPVYFGQRTNALLFRPHDLDRAMPHADPARFARLLADIRTRPLKRVAVPLAARVQAEIRSRLPEGYPPVEDVADALGIARWTLQRRLAADGLTYSNAVCTVRRTLAQTYLAEPHLPISTISSLLGYAELSPFSRACRRWFGASPEHLRAGMKCPAA